MVKKASDSFGKKETKRNDYQREREERASKEAQREIRDHLGPSSPRK
jgi:hypothetical protein